MKHKKTMVLDEYESEILDAFESGQLKPVRPSDDFREIARNTMRKNRKINIRIAENDLSALQRKAARDVTTRNKGDVRMGSKIMKIPLITIMVDMVKL